MPMQEGEKALTLVTGRPMLLIDEAQEMHSSVINELRVLTSKDFDSSSCCASCCRRRAPHGAPAGVSAGAPLGSRNRRRLPLDGANHEHLVACLEHLLAAAGNTALMTPTLQTTVVDHSAGNFRVMMNIADELLASAAERQVAVLDEKLYFDGAAPAGVHRHGRPAGHPSGSPSSSMETADSSVTAARTPCRGTRAQTMVTSTRLSDARHRRA